jgi:large subunit ribosomal protein L15
MPLARRVPKRGFHSPFKKEFQTVNVEFLQKLSADGKMGSGIVTPEVLARLGVVKKAESPVKILGGGELSARLDVAAHAFSKSAIEKIQGAGGVTRVITAAAKK